MIVADAKRQYRKQPTPYGPTNEEMAHECLRNAEKRAPGGAVTEVAKIEAMAAQTYATLALVDAIREVNAK